MVLRSSSHFNPPNDLARIPDQAPSWSQLLIREDMINRAVGGADSGSYRVAYEVPGVGNIIEAEVVRSRNGLVVNYSEPYMRRRDPECMVFADGLPTDQTTVAEHFGKPFYTTHKQVHDWQLRITEQIEAGDVAYDTGARIQRALFAGVLTSYEQPDLDPLGRRIRICFKDGGGIRDFEALA